MADIIKVLCSKKHKYVAAHESKVLSLHWNNHADELATGSLDRTAKVFSFTETGQSHELIELKGHSSDVESVRWVDRRTLASGSDDKTIRLWDCSSSKCIETFEIGAGVLSLAVHPNGQMLAVGDREDTVSLFDIRTMKLLDSIDFSQKSIQVNELAWEYTGTHLIATMVYPGGHAVGGIEVIATQKGMLEQVVNLPAHMGMCCGIAVSASQDNQFAVGSLDGLVSLWSGNDLACLGTFDESDGSILCLSFNYDGSMLAIGSNEQEKRILFADVDTMTTFDKKELSLDATNVNGVTQVKWHPKLPNVLAYCGNDMKGSKVGFVRVVGTHFT